MVKAVAVCVGSTPVHSRLLTKRIEVNAMRRCGTDAVAARPEPHAATCMLLLLQVLGAAGCELVGGHSSEGPELSAGAGLHTT